MPKIILPEIKLEVISLFSLGYSRDEIADEVGIGKGTVSKYLEEFRKEIGIPTYEAIKAFGKFLRRHGISHGDALMGTRTAKLMERYGVKEEESNSFFENLAKVLGENNVVELLEIANKLVEIKRKTGKSPQETLAEYEKLSQEIPLLAKKKKDLETKVEQLCRDLDRTLKSHNTTIEDLHQFTVIKSQYKEIGLDLEDLPKYHAALKEIKRQGYDVIKVLEYLREIDDLGKKVEACKQAIRHYQSNVAVTKNELETTTKKLEEAKSESKRFTNVIKIIEQFMIRKQDPSTIIQWNEILQQNNLTVAEFYKILKHYKGLVQYLNHLKNEISSYEKRLQTLQATLTDLYKEKQVLTDQVAQAKIKLEEKIEGVKKEIEHLEATNPLRLVYDGKGEPHKVFSAILIFLRFLKKWLQKNNILDSSLMFLIERLMERLDREIKNGKN